MTLSFSSNSIHSSSFTGKPLLTFAFLSQAGNLSITNNSISQSYLDNLTLFNLMYHTNTLISNNLISNNTGSSSPVSYFIDFNHFGGLYDMT